MPRGMYVGSAWIGFAIFMLICWFLSVSSARFYVAQGIGSAANFRAILAIIAIFGFAFPMMIGIRTLRRTRRQVQAAEEHGKRGANNNV
jgi:hypothetical protein